MKPYLAVFPSCIRLFEETLRPIYTKLHAATLQLAYIDLGTQ